MIRLLIGQLGLNFQQEQSFLSLTVCQNLFSFLSTGHEADHSPSYSAKVKNTWSFVCALCLQCLVHIQELAKFTFNEQTVTLVIL